MPETYLLACQMTRDQQGVQQVPPIPRNMPGILLAAPRFHRELQGCYCTQCTRIELPSKYVLQEGNQLRFKMHIPASGRVASVHNDSSNRTQCEDSTVYGPQKFVPGAPPANAPKHHTRLLVKLALGSKHSSSLKHVSTGEATLLPPTPHASA